MTETHRTLQLTHDEVAIIQRALGIAEKTFASLRQNYIETVVNVSGIVSKDEANKEADFMLENLNKFFDLQYEIKNGNRDV